MRNDLACKAELGQQTQQHIHLMLLLQLKLHLLRSTKQAPVCAKSMHSN
jgi:hypothetical protein